jgi:hypothetical protein
MLTTIDLTTEAVNISETLVSSYQSTCCSIAEDSYILRDNIYLPKLFSEVFIHMNPVPPPTLTVNAVDSRNRQQNSELTWTASAFYKFTLSLPEPPVRSVKVLHKTHKQFNNYRKVSLLCVLRM